MKLCITAVGQDLDAPVDPRLGRAPYFLLVDSDTLACEAVANPACSADRGAGIMAAQAVADHDAEAVLTGLVGPNAFRALDAAGIKMFEGLSVGDTAREALAKFKQGGLPEVTVPSEDAPADPGWVVAVAREGKGLEGRPMPAMNALPRQVVAAFHHKGFATPVLGVTGGKGGVGKTTVAVNLACALAEQGARVALVDADVDGPNAALLLGLSLEDSLDVAVTFPEVNEARCNGCGACVEACRRHALFMAKGRPPQLFGDCNGCEACFLVCPEDALRRGQRQVGRTYRGEADSLTLYTGELLPVAEESAEVVKAVKARAFEDADSYDCLIVDTAPGAHCNVLFALKGADLVLAVTEPTPLGAHDLERILQLLDIVVLPGRVIVNRADLPGAVTTIAAIGAAHGAPVLAALPVDDLWLESCAAGRPLVRLAPATTAAGLVAKMARRLAEELRL